MIDPRSLCDASAASSLPWILPKFVAFRTLDKPLDWNNSSLIQGDVAEGVAKLTDEPGRDLLMFSSVGLMHGLMAHGLIDELRLWVHPVVIGAGQRLSDGSARTALKLLETTTLSSGVVILAYRAA